MRDRASAANPLAQADVIVLSGAMLQFARAISEEISRVSAHRHGASYASLDEPQLVDVAEAARLLGVSRMTVTRLCDQGRLPCVVVCRGRRQQLRRIPRAFIDAVASYALSAGCQVDLDEFGSEWLTRNASPDNVPQIGITPADRTKPRRGDAIPAEGQNPV